MLFQQGLILAISYSQVSSQLLGAGTGVGSCRAFPFHVKKVDWEVCPPGVSCCSEFGYCRTKVSHVYSLSFFKECFFMKEEWERFLFRDCNGDSNGIDLPLVVVQLEESNVSKALNFSQLKRESFFSSGKLNLNIVRKIIYLR